MEGQSLVPNRAVQTMTLAHREKLGQELLGRSFVIYQNHGRCDDSGSRILALLDAGADLSLRLQPQQQLEDEDHLGSGKSRSALLLLIQSGNLPLCRLLLQHDAPVTETSCREAVEQNISKVVAGSKKKVEEWRLFLEELTAKAEHQALLREERENARNHANEA